ncbi:PRC-barrel domain-containing protein [Deinococcus multiflagellatus]|uniref:PRC-barrel domain-containing protein n=1 Tax=Deinococcus multiflagellatus TaxID=1656887 RepID=A0ABW1ZIQ5_9DEIO
MARLIPMSELVRDRNYDLGDTYNVVGQTAYGYGGEKVGTVREALTDDGGQIRYLIVDVGGWFSAKEVMVPVGMARIEDDGVYFDNLSKDQVKGMSGYVAGQDYEYEAQVADERILRGVDTSTQHAAGNFNYTQRDDTMFQTPSVCSCSKSVCA